MTTTRTRIVFIQPTLLAGGAERVLITLANHLDRTRFEPHFMVVSPKGTLRPLLDPVILFHSLGGMKMRFCLPALINKLNHLRPDVIVSNMAAMNFNIMLAARFLKHRPRIILREAVTPSSIIDHQKIPAMVRMAYRTLYPKADLVLAPAQMIIDEFKDYLGMDIERFRVLYNPVDISRITNAWSVDTITDQTVRFVAAGRLHPQKGFDRLIRALILFKPDYKWNLTIYGEGAQRAELQSLIDQNNLGAQIHLAGLVDEPWADYAQADVFLLPSRWEGLPNVALESLAVGTPVIAMAEAGGIGEIAALGAPGSIKLATSMDDFIKMMTHVTPNTTTSPRESLLPAEFELRTVIGKFSDFLMPR